MAAKKSAVAREKKVRTSVSVSPELHKTITNIAKKKKVSSAWVVRDALEAYVRDQWPLLERRG